MAFGQRNRHDNDVHADNFDNVVQIGLVVMEMHVLVAAPVVVVH